MVAFETDPLEKELLQYLIDNFFEISGNNSQVDYAAYNPFGESTTKQNAFAHAYPQLTYSLKRDGYIVEGKNIQKLLPSEIQEQEVDSELLKLITTFGFEQTKGHLDQAIKNHTQGNWASANSQFRTFIESLLIEICQKLCPENEVKTGAKAMKFLTESVSPPFFQKN